MVIKLSSTVFAENNFQPLVVATKLRSALHADPVDHETIIRLVSDLTYDQRLEINSLFKKFHGKVLKFFSSLKNIQNYGFE